MSEIKKVPCTPAEYEILVRAIPAAKQRLAFALNARPGSAIHESAASIREQIAFLEKAVQTYCPVEGYVRPDGGTVLSVSRGSDGGN